MRKIQSQTNPDWGTFYNIPVQCLWKCQGLDKLGRLRNYHKPEATEETSQITAVWCPGWNLGNRSRTSAEKLLKCE